MDDGGGRAGLHMAPRAAARLSRLVDLALETVHLRPSQYRAMALLADGSSVATALARSLTVSPPGITGLIDGLVGRGYVERIPAAHDRRYVTHTLTPGGHAALAEADCAIRASLDAVVGHLPEPSRHAAMEGLALWLDAINLARSTTAT